MDPLYAFFIQWSPDIYGGDDEIDPKERGFVVISEEDEELSVLGTPVEDHFKSESWRQRSVSKDWEVRAKTAVSSHGGHDNHDGGAHNDSFLISETTLNSLKTQLGEIPNVPLRVFNRISFKRKREDSSGSADGNSAPGSATIVNTVGIKDWEVVY